MGKQNINDKEHILVCLSSAPSNPKIIQTAAAMAKQRRFPARIYGDFAQKNRTVRRFAAIYSNSRRHRVQNDKGRIVFSTTFNYKIKNSEVTDYVKKDFINYFRYIPFGNHVYRFGCLRKSD